MSLPKVYADFNAIEYFASDPSTAELALTGYGTLASLAAQKLRLEEGLRVLIYEPDDIECEAVIHFNVSRSNPAGGSGEWVARIDHRKIRTSTEQQKPELDFPCIVCGTVFAHGAGRDYREVCAGCGASVMEPLAPPKNAA